MDVPNPEREAYDGVRASEIRLEAVGQGARILVYEPVGTGPRPAVVIGAEGGGINGFIRNVAATLAHIGFVALVPDYYRGLRLTDPDDYSDIPGMLRMIEALDFRRAAHDFLDAITFARHLPSTDGKVAVWGYCTGGTVALFGACLDRHLDAAVLFYPSQPRFEAISATRPAHALDLVWNIACPVLIGYGDQDQVMTPAQLADLGRRLSGWGIDHEIVLYPGAGHAFSSPGFAMHDPEAAAAAWRDGVRFLAEKTGSGKWVAESAQAAGAPAGGGGAPAGGAGAPAGGAGGGRAG